MIPLWTSAIRPSAEVCGWALTSLGAPWVAQRVCPMPRPVARQRLLGQQLLQVGELAGLLGDVRAARRSRWPPRRSRTRGTPAAAGPRPRRRAAACGPTYPTIPHMAASLTGEPRRRPRVCRSADCRAYAGSELDCSSACTPDDAQRPRTVRGAQPGGLGRAGRADARSRWTGDPGAAPRPRRPDQHARRPRGLPAADPAAQPLRPAHRRAAPLDQRVPPARACGGRRS